MGIVSSLISPWFTPITNRLLYMISDGSFWNGYFDSMGKVGNLLIFLNIITASALALQTQGIDSWGISLVVWQTITSWYMTSKLQYQSSHTSPNDLHNGMLFFVWNLSLLISFQFGKITPQFAFWSLIFFPLFSNSQTLIHSIIGP